MLDAFIMGLTALVRELDLSTMAPHLTDRVERGLLGAVQCDLVDGHSERDRRRAVNARISAILKDIAGGILPSVAGM